MMRRGAVFTVFVLTLFYFCFIKCSGPIVPLQSTAQVKYIYYSYADMYAQHGGELIETGYMEIYTDMLNHKLFLNASAYDTIAPDANSVLNSSLLYQNTEPTFETNNRQCYQSGNAYGDFYWWIQNSTEVSSTPCLLNPKTTCYLYTYTYIDVSYHDKTIYTTILDSNNYIQQLNITDYYIDDNFSFEMGYLSMNFHLFQPAIYGNPFVEPEICYSHQSESYFCNQSPKQAQTIYWLRDYGETTIGPNVGDLLGYTAYLCWKSSLGKDVVLTQANIQLNSTWGQYATCYSLTDCTGGNAYSVGRECPYGFFYLQGQCDDLSSYGQWFSLLQSARCPLLSTVGTNGCAWHFRKTIKSISFNCLKNRGFFDVCYEDAQIPFNKASQVVSSAFKYCPAVSDVDEEDFYVDNVDKFSSKERNFTPHSGPHPLRFLKKSTTHYERDMS